MTFLRIFSTTSALALVASPALALTADQVWSDWKDMLDSYGAEISTASEDMSGGRLTVNDLTATFNIDDGSMAMNLGDITFAEQGDGSVVISMEEMLPLTMDIVNPQGKEGRVGFTINQTGAKLVASGDSDNMRYDFDYPSLGLSDFTVEGDDVPEDLPVVFDMMANGVSGFMSVTGGDIRSFETESTIASLTANMQIDDPNEGKGGFRMNIADLTQDAHGTFADIEMDMSLAELIEAGISQNGSGTYGPSTYEIEFDGPDGAFQMAMAAESGTLDFSIGENGLSYGGITRGLTATLGGAGIPIPPVSFRMAETEGRFTMPMLPSDEPQDFGLVMTMIGVEVDDMLWGMIDPAGMLPRDPASVVVDLGGSGILQADITDPEYMESPQGPPGTLESLDINALQLKIAGAELTGDGEFAFNNSMGMPLPSGTVNLMLTGGNGLLDTLVNMGLVPEDQAMGARMMLGMFARPGDGPDTLISTIEVNEDGSVLANGQRIK